MTSGEKAPKQSSTSESQTQMPTHKKISPLTKYSSAMKKIRKTNTTKLVKKDENISPPLSSLLTAYLAQKQKQHPNDLPLSSQKSGTALIQLFVALSVPALELPLHEQQAVAYVLIGIPYQDLVQSLGIRDLDYTFSTDTKTKIK
jgi:hypothetical protein